MNQDWELGLGIGILDWDWRLGLGIGMGDWDWGLGLGLGTGMGVGWRWNWGFGIRIGDWDWGWGLGIGDLDLCNYIGSDWFRLVVERVAGVSHGRSGRQVASRGAVGAGGSARVFRYNAILAIHIP